MSLFGRGDFEVNCSSWSMTASSYKEMYFHILYCFQAMSYGKMLLREANQEIKLKAVTDDEYEAIESFCHPAQAVAFCNTVKDNGFAENFDAITGEANNDPAYTWTSSVYLTLLFEYLKQ